MSGETEKQVSGWTVDTVKEYFENRLKDMGKALDAALNAAQRSSDKAEAAQKQVNEGQNEFRGQQKDLITTMLPRKEYDTAHQALQKQVDDLKRLVFIGLGLAIGASFIVPYLLR